MIPHRDISVPLSVFTLLDMIQKEYRGEHFHTLGFYPAQYVSTNIRITSGKKYTLKPEGPVWCRRRERKLIIFSQLDRIEHFLRIVQENFPGIGFQDLIIDNLNPHLCVTDVSFRPTPPS